MLVLRPAQMNHLYWCLLNVCNLKRSEVAREARLTDSQIKNLQCGVYSPTVDGRLRDLLRKVREELSQQPMSRSNLDTVHEWRRATYAVIGECLYRQSPSKFPLRKPLRKTKKVKQLYNRILAALAQGARPSSDVMPHLLKYHSQRYIYQALKDLNIQRTTRGFGPDKETWWDLPPLSPTSDNDASNDSKP